MIDPGVKDRVVLVTGGNNPHGIGAATARAFAAQGAAVFIHYFRAPSEPSAASADEGNPGTPGVPFFLAMQRKSAEGVVRSIGEQGGQAAAWEADLADPAVIPRLFDRVEEEFGPVDVLVSNAADYAADTFLPDRSLEHGDRALWAEGPLKSTISAEGCDRHFAVNTRAVTLMMAEFTRRHVEHNRHWGRIVNVSADCSWGCPGEI